MRDCQMELAYTFADCGQYDGLPTCVGMPSYRQLSAAHVTCRRKNQAGTPKMPASAEIQRLKQALEGAGFSVELVSPDAMEMRLQVEANLRRLRSKKQFADGTKMTRLRRRVDVQRFIDR